MGFYLTDWDYPLKAAGMINRRVYIYYTLAEIQENLNCGHDKATKLLVELDTKSGCGLIERVKQGQGRPARIYVKRFTTGTRPM